MSEACVFCKVLSGELPSRGVVSTEACYAFADVAPVAPTHLLVVPRVHLDDAEAIEASHGGLLAEMFSVARAAAAAEGIAGTGYRLVLNVGEDAQNSVRHLHMHVIGGRRLGWPPG